MWLCPLNVHICKMHSQETRDRVKKKAEEGYTYEEIALFMDLPKSTVQSIIKPKYIKKGGVGKPKKIDSRMNNKLKRQINILKKNKERITSTKIKNMNPELQVSKRTLQRALKNLGGKFKKQPQSPPLTELAQETRVKTCWDWYEKRVDFSKVIITDECRFSLDGPDNFQSWTFNPEDPSFHVKNPMQGGGVMVWAALLPDGSLIISHIKDKCTKEWYKNLLKKEVFPLLRAKYRRSFRWQQDNAPCHTAKVIKQYLKKERVKLLEWPPYCPDISPIENVFHILKNVIYDGPQFSRKETLWCKIQEVVELFNRERKDQMKKLHGELVKRGLLVINKNGKSIKK